MCGVSWCVMCVVLVGVLCVLSVFVSYVVLGSVCGVWVGVVFGVFWYWGCYFVCCIWWLVCVGLVDVFVLLTFYDSWYRCVWSAISRFDMCATRDVIISD